MSVYDALTIIRQGYRIDGLAIRIDQLASDVAGLKRDAIMANLPDMNPRHEPRSRVCPICRLPLTSNKTPVPGIKTYVWKWWCGKCRAFVDNPT